MTMSTRLLARHLAREIEREEVKEVSGARMDPTHWMTHTLGGLTQTNCHPSGDSDDNDDDDEKSD